MSEWADGVRRDRAEKKANNSYRKAQRHLENGNVTEGVSFLRRAADARETLAKLESRTKVAEEHREVATRWREFASKIESGDVNLTGNSSTDSKIDSSDTPADGSNGTGDISSDDINLHIEPEVPDIDFSDVGGMDDLKRELREKIAEPVSSDDEFASQFQISTVPGVLLQGPPGTGKTHITRALAGELDDDWSFIDIRVDEMTSALVGQGAKKIAAAFDMARKHEPTILFFDEIDSLAGSRADGTQRTQSERQMLTTMLTEMNDLNDDDVDIVVIGATNDPESVDPALRNPQRFSEVIEVPLPDAQARIDVLRVTLSEYPVDREDIDLEVIAEATEGFSASDMATVGEDASRKAWTDSKEAGETIPINQQHIKAAIDDRKQSLDDAEKGGYLE